MKVRRYLTIILLFFIIISFPVLRKLTAASPEVTLTRAFGDSGAAFVSSEITFTGSSKNKLKTETEMKDFSAKIAGILDAFNDDKPEKVDNESFEGFEFHGFSGKEFNFTLSTLKSKMAAELGKSYVTLHIVNNSPALDLQGIRTRVMGALSGYGIRPRVNTLITGSYAGKLDTGEMNGIGAAIFKRAGARKVNGIRENSLVSVSAFSKSIDNWVEVDGKKINLNFAVRYNSYEGKTYIWLATPLITTEY